MLTIRAARLQSRIPRPACRLVDPIIREESVYRLDSILSQSRFTQLHRQQVRSYLFIPVSWTETKERLERWLEHSDSRIVRVILLKNRQKKFRSLPPPFGTITKTSNTICTQQQLRQKNNTASKIRQPHGGKLKLSKWKRVRSQLRKRYQGPSLQYIQPWMSSMKVREVAKNYQRWKDRRKEQYGKLKSRYKSRRKVHYQRWNLTRNQVWIKIQKVLVEEYSKKEWFDELGRPLTARDSTGRFVNPWQSQSTNGVHSLTTILRWRWQRFMRENISFLPTFKLPTIQSGETNLISKPSPLLTHEVPPLPVADHSNLQFTWIGHSTALFQIRKTFTILTDPIFSKRASPFSTFLGVERELPPAYTIEELTNHKVNNGSDRDRNFDVCCITHDHYDHMDTESVKNLRDLISLWVVPCGIGNWLAETCSIRRSKIIELEWWEQLHLAKHMGDVVVVHDHDSDSYGDDDVLTITCCPSSHWGGRTLFDRNTRLWCSFAFSVASYKVFFCGDTGYPENFPLFRQIGDTLGPFDLSCIPIGAYEPRDMNKDSHCNPQEALQIHRDLHSKRSVGIHWGSFQLTEESMDAPPKDLRTAICREENQEQPRKQNVLLFPIDNTVSHPNTNFSVLGHGETLVLGNDQLGNNTA